MTTETEIEDEEESISGADISAMLQEWADYFGGTVDPDMGEFTITPENAGDYGIVLDEGYSVQVSPWGFRKWNVDMTTPEGWSYTNAGGVVSPEGESSTWDEIDLAQAEYDTYIAENIDVTEAWDSVMGQMQAEVGYIDVGWQRFELGNPQHVEILMKNHPDEFLDSMRVLGHTPEVEALLRAWEWDEDSMKDYFSEHRPWVLPEWARWVVSKVSGGEVDEKHRWPAMIQKVLGGESGTGGVMAAIDFLSAPWSTLNAVITVTLNKEKSRLLEQGSGITDEFLAAKRASGGNPLILFDDKFQELADEYSKQMVSGWWRIYWDMTNPVWYITAGGTLGTAASMTAKIPLLGASFKGAAAAMKMAEGAPGWLIGKSLGYFIKQGARIPGPVVKKVLGTTKHFTDDDLLIPFAERIDKLLVDNWQRSMIQRIANAPVINRLTMPTIRAILGKNVLVKKASMAIEHIVGKAAIGYGSIGRTGQQMANLAAQRLYAIKGVGMNPIKYFGFKVSTVGTVTSQKMLKRLLPQFKGEANAGTLEHIFTQHKKYNWEGIKQGEKYIIEFNQLMDDALNFLKKHSCEPKHLVENYMHRVVLGKLDEAGKLIPLRGVAGKKASLYGKASSQYHRIMETTAEGVRWSVVYSNDPLVALTSYIEEAYMIVAKKQFVDYIGVELAKIGRAGMTPKEILAAKGLRMPAKEVLEAEWDYLIKQVTTSKGQELITLSVVRAGELAEARGFLGAINRAMRGEVLPGQTLKAIERRFPEIGARLRNLVRARKRAVGLGKDTTKVNADLNALKAELKEIVKSRSTSYHEAKTEVAFRMEQARQAGIGKGYAPSAAFGGKIFNQEFIDAFNLHFGQQSGNSVLKVTADSAAILRITKAALDLSFMAIQGMLSWGFCHSYIFINPKAGAMMMGEWYKAFAYGVATFFDPAIISRYMAKNQTSVQQRLAAGGTSGVVDFLEAVKLTTGIGGIFAKYSTKIPFKPYQRAEAAFYGSGEMVRDAMWKILSPKALEGGNEFALARFLDRITGLTDSAAMGVSLTVRQIEQSFIWFAPNYTRACLTVVADVFRGGYTGAMAREAVGGMIGAGAMFFSASQYSLSILSGKSHDEAFNDVLAGFCVVQDPRSGDWSWKPSARFMGLQIGNQHFSVGGFWYGLYRFAGNLAGSIIDEDKRVNLWTLTKDGKPNNDNPFMYWWYSRSSPFTGMGFDLATGRNFMGEPIESPQQYAEYIATRFEPIWMEQGLNWMIPGMATDYEIPESMLEKFLTPIAEVVGLRVLGYYSWGKFHDEVRVILSKKADEFFEDYYTPEELPAILAARDAGRLGWDNLDDIPKSKLLSLHPELNDLYIEAGTDSALKSSDLWKKWSGEQDAAQGTYYDQGDALIGEWQSGDITSTELRADWSGAGKTYGTILDFMQNDEDYATIYNFLEERGKDTGPYDSEIQIALRRYQAVMFTDYLDDRGDIDWDARDEAVDEYIEEYGEDTYEMIRDYYADKKLLEDTSGNVMNKYLIELAIWKEELGRDYWRLPYQPLTQIDDIEDVPDEYLKDWEAYQALETEIERDQFLALHPDFGKDWRGEFRAENPETDARLAIWGYGGKLQTWEAYNIVTAWSRESGVKLSQMGLGLPPRDVLEDYFGYNAIIRDFSGGSAEARLFRLEHPDFDVWIKSEDGPGLEMIEVHIESLRISAEWRTQDDIWKAITGNDKEWRAAERQKILDAPENAGYAEARRERDAWNKGISEGLVPDYVDWYISGANEWQHEWEDDWFLMEHPDFYKEMLDLGLWVDDPEEPRDFNKVVTRAEYSDWNFYMGLPTGGNVREYERWNNDALDACLVRVYGFTPIKDWWEPPWHKEY